MSVILTTPEQIVNSPLNTSSAKQQFTFSKAPRFQERHKQKMCEALYDLPSGRMKRTTSFGIGTRFIFKHREQSPPPNSYNLPSVFDLSKGKGQVYSLGIAREAYAKVYIKAHPAKDPSIPGPGAYETRNKPGKDANKFTFRPRTTLVMDLVSIKTPGPGTYQHLQAVNSKGNQFLSNIGSSGATTFNPPSSTRFKEVGVRLNNFPGPGHYTETPAITKTGMHFFSKYKSSLCRRFGQEARNHSSQIGSSKMTPGPGTYVLPSDFGIYQAQDKFVAETARTERNRNRNSSMALSMSTKGKDSILRTSSQQAGVHHLKDEEAK